MNNPGTFEGTIEEENLVKSINKGKYNDFFIDVLGQDKEFYALRLTEHKFSKLTSLKVAPKSDIVLIKPNNVITEHLKDNDLLLLEKELIYKKIDINYIPYTGISVKRKDSKNYQIHKFTPKSFCKLFNNAILGAGAMVYSNKSKIDANHEIINKIWNINTQDFFCYFQKKIKYESSLKDNHSSYKIIQKYCLKKIKEMINTDTFKKNYIFTGKNDFDEPFCATFSFIENKLSKYNFTDFYISQGSGRLKTPTIVIKPK